MSRYFFHTDDGRYYPDDMGTELEDLEEAKGIGLTVMWEMLRENPDEFWKNKENFKIHVVDEGRDILFTFELSGTVGPDPFA